MKPTSVKYISILDTEPILIEEKAGVLDEIGLTKERRKMDKAHNEMILTKFNLAKFKESPGAMKESQGEQSPFTAVIEKSERPVATMPTATEIQAAIDAPSISDPEYRAKAKAFLDAVIPAAKAETMKLNAEYNAISAELAELTQEYTAKLNAAKENIETFNAGIREEWEKFETANKGSRTPENFVFTTRNCRELTGLMKPHKYEQYTGLEAIRQTIKNYEQALEKDNSIENMKALAQSNAAKNTMTARRTGGEYIEHSTGETGGLERFIDTILK